MRDYDPRSISNARMRPATLEHAVEFYPDIVFLLLTDNPMRPSCRIEAGSTTDGNQAMLVQSADKSITLSLPRVDFDILRGIAVTLSGNVPISAASTFYSDPKPAIIDRIRSLIQVEFAGRGSF